MELGVELEFEVAVLLVGDEEGVWGTFDGGSDDDVTFDLVGGLAALDGPAGEIFSVKEGDEAGVIG